MCSAPCGGGLRPVARHVRALLCVLVLGACKASIPEGSLSCDEDGECPTSWHCVITAEGRRCYSSAQGPSVRDPGDAGTASGDGSTSEGTSGAGRGASAGESGSSSGESGRAGDGASAGRAGSAAGRGGMGDGGASGMQATGGAAGSDPPITTCPDGMCPECDQPSAAELCDGLTPRECIDGVWVTSAPCDGLNATWSCTAGQCAIEDCVAPFEDCNLRPDDGCEADLSSETANCGSCTTRCAGHRASWSCNGSCAVAGCEPGWGDCNRVASDGCEHDVTVDPDHCGRCENPCASDLCEAETCLVVQTHGSSSGPRTYAAPANILFGIPVTVPADGYLVGLGFNLVSTAANLHVYVGVYGASAAGQPTQLLHSSQELTPAMGRTGVAVAPRAITAGTYWVFFVANGTATFASSVGPVELKYISYPFATLPGAFAGSPSSMNGDRLDLFIQVATRPP